MDLKVWRAEGHRDALDEMLKRVTDGHLYTFDFKIKDQGLQHVYYAVAPPAIPDSFVGVLGDCLHNLRSSLDHLACQLARLQGDDFDRASFPVHKHRYNIGKNGSKKPCLDINIRSDIRKRLNRIQPYQGTPIGRRLALLHDLDIRDKHRAMIVVAAAARGTTMRVVEGGYPTGAKVKGRLARVSRKPLEDGKPCVWFGYPTPQLEVDPHLKVATQVVFGDGGPAARRGILAVVDDLIRLVKSDVMPMFMPFFGEFPMRSHRTFVDDLRAPDLVWLDEAIPASLWGVP
jgi:hypothetical protein